MKTMPAASRRTPHRGMTVILVLAMLSITLALSYAMLRTQATNEQVQRNSSERGSARQAAQAGMSIALRKMHEANWGGVGVTLSGELGDGLSYRATYTTGDASLTASSPDYWLYPYRVTVTAVGTATDPGSPGIEATHTIRTVVQLVPRKLADEPANWTALQPYTVCQWGTGLGREFNLDFPSRIEGPVSLQNEIRYLANYPGDGDERPFDGQIDEVVIFGSALTGAEILALKTGTLLLPVLAALPGRDPIAWWRLDEASGTSVASSQWNGHHGLFDGATPGNSSVAAPGSSLSANFDGYNDHIHLGGLNVGGSEITILAWFKADSFNEFGRLVAKATGVDEADQYWMLSTAEESGRQRLRFRVKTSSGTDTLVASSGNLSTGVWTFAAAVYSGSQMRLYKDGVLVGSQSKSGSLTTNSSVLASIGNSPVGSPRARLLRDLEAMRKANLGDHRPFSTTVNAPLAATPGEVQSLITDETNVPLNNISQGSGVAPVTHPGNVQTYRLYPGGQSYSVPTLGSSLSNVSYGPDPQTNPLGLFKYPYELALNNSVTVQGTLLTYDNSSRADVQVRGSNVRLSAVNLPQLYGDSRTYQLPVIMARDDVSIYDGSQSAITGLMVAGDEYEVLNGSQGTTLSVQGKLLTAELSIAPRSEWHQSTDWWKARLTSFMTQLNGAKPARYFPQWLKNNYSLDYVPKITIKPDPASVTYHWHDWTQPLLVAHPDDGALRWDIIDWRDNP